MGEVIIMKKFISLTLCAALAVFMLAGCGGTGASSGLSSSSSSSVSSSTAATGDAVKTGLAVVTSLASSADAGDKDGLAQADSTIAAVTVDNGGKIVKCYIDAAQTKVNFSKEGKITTDLKSAFRTKQELKEEYGLKKASKIGKEWHEQANAFAAYCVGKTADEVKGIALSSEGTVSDKDLSTSVTIHAGDFVSAVSKAAQNAQDLGAKAGDKLGVGVNTDIASSKDAADSDGLAEIDSYYTASTFDASGKVTSCVIDASQGKISFSKAGKITSDTKAEVATKDELKEQYEMKKASKIGKEWYEQAAAFAKYVVGKTADEVKGIAVTDQGVPSGADLNTSVTIHIAPFQSIVQTASQRAQ